MISTLFLLKLSVSIGAVLGLSVIAERVSPRVAGVLAGMPLGTAIVLFFYGLEINPVFASESAVFNLVGLVAMQSFFYAYYYGSARFKNWTIIQSSILAIASFFTVAYILHFIPFTRGLALGTVIISIPIFTYLFRNIQNATIKERAHLSTRAIASRAVASGVIILVITSTARFIGSTWAGLFSPFPTIVFPLLLIIHYTYDTRHVHTILKNVPNGLGSLVIYSLIVSIAYPLYGIYYGTMIAYAAALLYLGIYFTAVKN